jgi:GrpB-like predicted nucleotidyltransferase (UPF0157 family)
LAAGAARHTVLAVQADPPDAALPDAGDSDTSDPVAAWCRLREAEGQRATGIDLYWLAAGRRGLAAPHELPLADRAGLIAAVMPVLLPGFGFIAEAERDREPVEIVPYDPGWPARFTRWRDRLTAVLGPAALRIEHVGSTSVPGLAAKDIIDIQVSVADIGDEARYVGQVESAGLQLRSRDELHRYFRPYPDQPRDVHLHVCHAGGAWEREHLLFRDYLRAHPAAAGRYLAAKRAAAVTWRDDCWAYTEAKTGVVLDILDEAGAWARATGWAVAGPP